MIANGAGRRVRLCVNQYGARNASTAGRGGARAGAVGVRDVCGPESDVPFITAKAKLKVKKSAFRASSLLAAAQACSWGPVEHFI